MNLAAYADLIVNLGSFGVIVVLFWRVMNHTLPRLAANFEKGVDKSWTHCEQMLKDQRNDLKEMLSQQRSDFREMLIQHKLVCQQDLNQMRKTVEENGK